MCCMLLTRPQAGAWCMLSRVSSSTLNPARGWFVHVRPCDSTVSCRAQAQTACIMLNHGPAGTRHYLVNAHHPDLAKHPVTQSLLRQLYPLAGDSGAELQRKLDQIKEHAFITGEVTEHRARSAAQKPRTACRVKG